VGGYDNLIGQLSDDAVSMPALGSRWEMWFSAIAPRTSGNARKARSAIKDQNKIDIYVVNREGAAPRRCARTNSETAGSRLIESTTRSLLTRSRNNFKPPRPRVRESHCSTATNGPQVKVKNLATREESLIASEALLDSVAKFFNVSAPFDHVSHD